MLLLLILSIFIIFQETVSSKMRNETLSSMARNIPSSRASIRRCPSKYTTRGSRNINLCLRYAFTTHHMNYSFIINMRPAQTYLGPNTSTVFLLLVTPQKCNNFIDAGNALSLQNGN